MYRHYYNRLVPLYGDREARAIADYVLDVRFGLTRADVICGGVERMTADERAELERVFSRLEGGEPVQYVVGETMFCGRTFHVRPGVLIPRPETEELCALVTSRCKSSACLNILDIGTGSGCIAVTLAADMPQAAVTAWDISSEALGVARENATLNGVGVAFERRDMLSGGLPDATWDVIVSNPPYICNKEKKDMCANVLDHEPHTALFVPDDDPLLFYRAIARYAASTLTPGGRLFFEINAAYGRETAGMMRRMGFEDVAVHRDMYGRERIAEGRKADH